MNLFILKIISFFYLFFITLALLIPIDFLVVNKLVNDQNIPNNNTSFFIHFIIFFILYNLFNFSYKSESKILFFLIIYSIVIEILQLFTSRGFQISDIIFNLIGIIFAFFIIRIFEKYKIFNLIKNHYK